MKTLASQNTCPNCPLELVEDALNRYENSVKLRLMKLKLSLQAVPPPQLAQQIDEMIEIMATDSNQ